MARSVLLTCESPLEIAVETVQWRRKPPRRIGDGEDLAAGDGLQRESGAPVREPPHIVVGVCIAPISAVISLRKGRDKKVIRPLINRFPIGNYRCDT